jgi:hypothetical protein
MTKGICDLRKFLHKAQVRLTQAGSLIYSYLSAFCKYALHQQLRRLLFANTPPNRFLAATILCELTQQTLC